MMVSVTRWHLAMAAVILAGVVAGLEAEPADPSVPKPPLSSPEQGLRSLRVVDGFRVELVACEPHVVDPVAMAWDADGQLFVVEMGGYPNGPPAGRVKRLEDRDGDGRIDHSVVFADGLAFPTGLFPWRGGWLVTAAPDIFYFKDTDGDGKADIRRVLYTGFGTGNQQHRVNGLIWGMDGWIYGANGDSGGGIRIPDQPNRPKVNINGRDFRIRPDERAIEPVTGHSQFGIAFDAWNQRYLCDNRVHIRIPLLFEWYLKRNPYLAVRTVEERIAEYGPVGARVYPISPPQERFNDYDNVNHFTSACGIHVYEGGRFPSPYAGSAYVCEPVHNLVHRCTLHRKGVSLVARRGEKGSEFLASTDPWFRPVFLATGPDGAMYLADYYRVVIEHPRWIPLNVQKRLDLRAGSDRGRIYRIVPSGTSLKPMPSLRQKTSAELVKSLGNDNAWVRDTAQRLLVERRDRSVIPLLEAQARQADDAQARARSLWTLHLLGGLKEDLLAAALADRNPRVREQALRLADFYVASSKMVADAVVPRAKDPDIRVRYQAAFTLGGVGSEEALAALVRLAATESASYWFRMAILSSIGDRVPQFIAAITDQQGGFLGDAPLSGKDDGRLRFVRALAAVVAARGKRSESQALVSNLASLPDRRWALAAMAGLSGSSWTDQARQRIRPYLKRLLDQSKATAVAEDQPLAERLGAIACLAWDDFEAAAPVFERLLESNQRPEIQKAAARALARRREPEALTMLLEGWRQHSPTIRRMILDAALHQRDRWPILLHALESGQIKPSEIALAQRDQLLRQLDETDRKRVQRLFASTNGDRQQVIARYRDVLDLPRDPLRGEQVFLKNCASCHRLAGQGVAVGPSLSDVRTRPEASILEDILDPNRALAPGYVVYVVETQSGRIVSGVLAAETATSVTLRRADGVEDVILRKDIAAMQSTGQSLMPVGVENTLSRQDLADLLGYLKRGAR